ncbi:hypothetical protein VTO42DRAFT_8018 [Malbranchea cinnamomea]
MTLADGYRDQRLEFQVFNNDMHLRCFEGGKMTQSANAVSTEGFRHYLRQHATENNVIVTSKDLMLNGIPENTIGLETNTYLC